MPEQVVLQQYECRCGKKIVSLSSGQFEFYKSEHLRSKRHREWVAANNTAWSEVWRFWETLRPTGVPITCLAKIQPCPTELWSNLQSSTEVDKTSVEDANSRSISPVSNGLDTLVPPPKKAKRQRYPFFTVTKDFVNGQAVYGWKCQICQRQRWQWQVVDYKVPMFDDQTTVCHPISDLKKGRDFYIVKGETLIDRT